MNAISANLKVVMSGGERPIPAVLFVSNKESTTGQEDVNLGHALALVHLKSFILDDGMSFESFKGKVQEELENELGLLGLRLHDVYISPREIEDARRDANGSNRRQRFLNALKTIAALGGIMGPIIALLNDLGCF